MAVLLMDLSISQDLESSVSLSVLIEGRLPLIELLSRCASMGRFFKLAKSFSMWYSPPAGTTKEETSGTGLARGGRAITS